jgi:hypothetical protein
MIPTDMKNKMNLFQRILQRQPLRFFLLLVAVSGTIGIIVIYSLHLNYPPIRSDGVGYYLYLPAYFIYHDLSLQSIAEEHFGGLIPEWTGAYLWKDSQSYVIKYPIGEAVLMMPFFIFACLTAFVTKGLSK